jgi:hypothetical protein
MTIYQTITALTKARETGKSIVVIEPVILDQWRTPDVMKLAYRVFVEDDIGSLPILADALQDAGCENLEILMSCQTGEMTPDAVAVVEAVLTTPEVDRFFQDFIRAALWSSNDEDGIPLDESHDVEDIEPSTRVLMKAECVEFYTKNRHDIETACLKVHDDNGPEGQAGYDFWMTRHGHGVGFWETNDWEEKAGERLTVSAGKYEEWYLYVEDGAIYGN